MDSKITKEEIYICIAQALDINPKKISINSKMLEIEEWDSFGHLGILVALDKKFDGKVASISEMASATTVKKMIDLLISNKLI